MATFYANPNENSEPWIERAAIQGLGFRIWHVIFICFAVSIGLVILICCCVRIRVPRTKQEIEADYRRKMITSKFKERLKLIENHDMDTVDLKRALEIMQKDFKWKAKPIEDRISLQIYPDYNVDFEDISKNLRAEPQNAKSLSNA